MPPSVRVVGGSTVLKFEVRLFLVPTVTLLPRRSSHHSAEWTATGHKAECEALIAEGTAAGAQRHKKKR